MSNNLILNQNTINFNNHQNNNQNNITNIESLSTSFKELNMASCSNILNINDISNKINNEQELDAFLEHIKQENSSNTTEDIQMHKELLEVRNRQNTKYFDDEDFIYCKFELPPKIIEEISHSGDDFVDYFGNLLDNFESSFEFENYEIYCNICILYQYIVTYYFNMKNNNIESESNHFTNEFLLIVKNVCHDVMCDCCLDSSDSDYTYFHNYTKEVMHGLRLIITQLSAVIRVLDCHNYQNINNYPIKYKEKVLKLVNNMCVILLFIKFYYNQPDFNFETTEEEDAMTDFGNLVPKEWQIQKKSKKNNSYLKPNNLNSNNINNNSVNFNDVNSIDVQMSNMEIN